MDGAGKQGLSAVHRFVREPVEKICSRIPREVCRQHKVQVPQRNHEAAAWSARVEHFQKRSAVQRHTGRAPDGLVIRPIPPGRQVHCWVPKMRQEHSVYDISAVPHRDV